MKFASAGAVALLIAVGFSWVNGSMGGARAVAENVRSSPILDAVSPVDVQQATVEGNAIVPLRGARAAVVPHHDLAAALVGRLVGSLRSAHPKTIVIIGPDHPNAGHTRYTVSVSDWSGLNRRFPTNTEAVEALRALPAVSVSEELIAREHSVLVPLPFLAAQFPDARFVLLTVRGGFDLDADRQLAETLGRSLGPDDLVIASVDFSHYKPFPAAQAEDEISLAALRSGNPDALAQIPADSPSSLVIAEMYAHDRGARELSVLDHSNSALLLGNPALTETTSYVTVVWR